MIKIHKIQIVKTLKTLNGEGAIWAFRIFAVYAAYTSKMIIKADKTMKAALVSAVAMHSTRAMVLLKEFITVIKK
jgi:hypothetical protein